MAAIPPVRATSDHLQTEKDSLLFFLGVLARLVNRGPALLSRVLPANLGRGLETLAHNVQPRTRRANPADLCCAHFCSPSTLSTAYGLNRRAATGSRRRKTPTSKLHLERRSLDEFFPHHLRVLLVHAFLWSRYRELDGRRELGDVGTEVAPVSTIEVSYGD